MGYKLAGCEVLGCCEIDKQMNELYIKNHNPKYNFLMDIREFNNLPKEEIPEELFNLDILDGSPPCTTFSTAGLREETWGVKKKFREGQQEQVLDELSFVFIDTVNKLKPKTVIMENVKGLLLGEAFEYVRKIYDKFDEIGYRVWHWLLKGENMGVPQKRHRVFFVAVKKELNIIPRFIDMSFNYKPITYRDIKGPGKEFSEVAKKGKLYNLFMQANEKDKTLGDVNERLGGKNSYFQCYIIHDDDVLPTIRASRSYTNYRWEDKKQTTKEEVITAQTFPQDYDFGQKTDARVAYVCGMSVPPIMIKRIVERLIDQGIYDYIKE